MAAVGEDEQVKVEVTGLQEKIAEVGEDEQVKVEAPVLQEKVAEVGEDEQIKVEDPILQEKVAEVGEDEQVKVEASIIQEKVAEVGEDEQLKVEAPILQETVAEVGEDERVKVEAPILQKKVAEELALRPWEQHSSVIIIPRYDYNAPTSLLNNHHSGFFITCPIRKEKSATKEAISIFEKFIGCNSFLEETDGENVTKKRKLCSVDEKSEDISQNELSKDAGLSSEKNEELVGKKHTLSLVKLIRNGLLLFTFPKDSALDPVRVVSDILQSVDSGALKSLWCHRIFPIQTTCILNEKELGSVVSSLIHAVVDNQSIKFSSPLKFAVGYNRRGLDQTVMKSAKTSSSGSDAPTILDREKCFATVAAAVQAIISDAVVDLKSPEISILIECLPLSRMPKNTLVAAVSVLPQSLVLTKSKLSIKPLIKDPNANSGKQSKE